MFELATTVRAGETSVNRLANFSPFAFRTRYFPDCWIEIHFGGEAFAPFLRSPTEYQTTSSFCVVAFDPKIFVDGLPRSPSRTTNVHHPTMSAPRESEPARSSD